MDNNRFINLETFEITDSIPNYIIVDSLIADTIAILNKKGYKTLSSCSGHFYEFRKGLWENCDLDFLEDVKNDKLCEIEEIRDDSFDYWVNDQFTNIYIMFDGIYDFKNIPEGFKIENDVIISKNVYFYDKDKNRKNEKEIINEIEKYNKILKNWASNLPKIN